MKNERTLFGLVFSPQPSYTFELFRDIDNQMNIEKEFTISSFFNIEGQNMMEQSVNQWKIAETVTRKCDQLETEARGGWPNFDRKEMEQHTKEVSNDHLR